MVALYAMISASVQPCPSNFEVASFPDNFGFCFRNSCNLRAISSGEHGEAALLPAGDGVVWLAAEMFDVAIVGASMFSTIRRCRVEELVSLCHLRNMRVPILKRNLDCSEEFLRKLVEHALKFSVHNSFCAWRSEKTGRRPNPRSDRPSLDYCSGNHIFL